LNFKHLKFVSGFLLVLITIPFSSLAQKDSIIHDLDYYLENAVKSSPLLKDYANQVLTNRLDSLTIRAQNKPQVNGNISALYVPYDSTNNRHFGYDAAITNGGNYAVQIAATQNILNGNILKPQFETVNIQGKILKNTAKLSEHDIRHNVASQYITVWSDWSQLDNTKKVNKIMRQEIGILKPLVESGLIKQSAYLSF